MSFCWVVCLRATLLLLFWTQTFNCWDMLRPYIHTRTPLFWSIHWIICPHRTHMTFKGHFACSFASGDDLQKHSFFHWRVQSQRSRADQGVQIFSASQWGAGVVCGGVGDLRCFGQLSLTRCPSPSQRVAPTCQCFSPVSFFLSLSFSLSLSLSLYLSISLSLLPNFPVGRSPSPLLSPFRFFLTSLSLSL